MNQTSGFPTTGCFGGGGPIKLEKRTSGFNEILNNEQEVIIYNIQGIEVFSGRWTFGEVARLNWPANLEKGIYLVRFVHFPELGTMKLYKLD